MLSALGVGHTIEHLTEDHLFSGGCMGGHVAWCGEVPVCTEDACRPGGPLTLRTHPLPPPPLPSRARSRLCAAGRAHRTGGGRPAPLHCKHLPPAGGDVLPVGVGPGWGGGGWSHKCGLLRMGVWHQGGWVAREGRTIQAAPSTGCPPAPRPSPRSPAGTRCCGRAAGASSACLSTTGVESQVRCVLPALPGLPAWRCCCHHAMLLSLTHTPPLVPCPTDDNRQALLLRVVAEARREPVPEVHPAQAAVSARLSGVRDEYAAKAAAWEREQQQQELQHSMLRHSAAAAGAQPPMAAANPPPAGPTAASAAKPEFVQTRSTPTGAGGPAGLFSPAGPPVLTPRAPREQPAVHQPSPQQQAPQQAEWQPWAPPPPHPSDQPQLVAAKAAALDVLNGLVATAPLAAPMVPPSVFAQVAPPASRLVPPPQPQQPQQARGAAPVGRLGSAPLFLQPPPGLLAPAPQPSSQPTSEALAAVEAAARALKGTGGRAPLAIAPISRSSSGGVGSQQSGSPASASSGRGEA